MNQWTIKKTGTFYLLLVHSLCASNANTPQEKYTVQLFW